MDNSGDHVLNGSAPDISDDIRTINLVDEQEYVETEECGENAHVDRIKHRKEYPPRGVERSRSSSRPGRRTRRDPDHESWTWGHSSLPTEKFHHLEMAGTNADSPKKPSSTSSLGLKKLRQRKIRDAKDNRRQEVKNSLAHFLYENNDKEEGEGEETEDEDETIISGLVSEIDVGKVESQRSRADEPKSPRTTSSRLRRKTHGRSREEDDDNRSVQSKSTRRAPRRHLKSDLHDEDPLLSGKRRIGRSKSSRSRGGRGRDDDEQSARSIRDDHNKRNHRKDHTHDKHNNDKLLRRSWEEKCKGASHKAPLKEKLRQKAPTSPELKDGSSPKENKLERKDTSLSGYIHQNDTEKQKIDCEETSEESSRISYGFQETLLQFDPTSAGFINSVDQRSGHVTSETFKHGDGTESKLHIRELDGLPTFENPEALHDSAGSGMNLETHSTHAKKTGLDDMELSPKKPDYSSLSIDSSSPSKSTPIRESPRNRFKNNNTKLGVRAVTTSFLQRGKKKDDLTQEDLHSSMASFFARFHKKDDSEEVSDFSDDEPKSARWGKKRTPKNMLHQSLDDEE